MQKPPFCTPKTILLHAKNHAFVLRTCNIHRMNTLRTFRKISTFNYEIPNEHSRKHPTYTPPGVGANSSCPYPYITKYAFSHYQIHIFISPHTHFCSPFCGYIRICGRDKSAPTAANGLLITLRTHHEMPTKHSARRRGRFIAPVSLHNQIRIFILHFVGVFVYAGTINRPLQLLMGCNNVANTHRNTQLTLRQA